ncbi:cupredoxin domain-containing protein [Nocardioides sp.]|uniref:cupredoxin domain-containing protein n=1 Tax=Nocardioides sp. TaxID=35761 RepID=UPI0027353DE7|nr:cupredoxin domain-containing protein [Nocardioides sp.]MDP3892525.1 cupredoxin domain-containing protein [Nocardioides sp.]
MTASSGTVGTLVENRDPVRHTFTIEQLGIDVELPAGTNRRVEFTALAGTYAFHCTVPGHESMTGMIVVRG